VIIDSVATSHMPTPGGFISAFNVFIEAVYSSILPREICRRRQPFRVYISLQ